MQGHLINRTRRTLASQYAADELVKSYLSLSIGQEVEECRSLMQVQVDGLKVCLDSGIHQYFGQALFANHPSASYVYSSENALQLLDVSSSFVHPFNYKLFCITLGCLKCVLEKNLGRRATVQTCGNAREPQPDQTQNSAD